MLGYEEAVNRFVGWLCLLIGGLLLLPTVIAIVLRRGNRREDRNLCPVCRYDLRATPDRCPECGTVAGGVPTAGKEHAAAEGGKMRLIATVFFAGLAYIAAALLLPMYLTLIPGGLAIIDSRMVRWVFPFAVATATGFIVYRRWRSSDQSRLPDL